MEEKEITAAADESAEYAAEEITEVDAEEEYPDEDELIQDEPSDEGESDEEYSEIDDNTEDEGEEDESSDEEDDAASEDADADAEPAEEPVKTDSDLEAATKQLLRALGVNDADAVKAVRQLTAETMGITLEELDAKEAEAAQKQSAWSEQAKRDIEAIHEAFPASRKYKSLMELPNKELFAAYMDDKKKNPSAVAAFAASHPEIVKASMKNGGKHSDLGDTKTHITSSVPKSAKDTSIKLSKSEMRSLRETFGEDMTDAEIKELYKKVST